MPVATGRYGPALTPDSAAYFAAARSLADGRGWLLFTGQPIVDYAPGPSVILAMSERFGIDSAVAVRHLNAALLGLAVFISSLWLRAFIRSRSILAVGVLALVVSKPLVLTSAQALSDPLFIALSLVALLLLGQYDRTKARSALIGAAAAVGGAWTTRYIGVTLMETGGALLLVRGWRRKRQEAIVGGALFISISAFPIGIWLLRNYTLTGTPTGTRPGTISTVGDNIGRGLTALSLWALPIRIPGPWRISTLLCGVALLAFGALRAGRLRPRLDAPSQLPAAIVLFVLLYVSTIIILSTTMNIDSPNQRNLAPVYIPGVLLAVWSLDRTPWACENSPSSAAGVLGKVIVTASLLWVVHPAWQLKGFIQDALSDGAGYYATRTWMESELMRVIRGTVLDRPVFSNAADAIYLLTGRTDIKGVPRKRYGKSPVVVTEEIDEFRRTVTTRGYVYVAWFRTSGRIYLYTPEDLAAEFALRPIIEVSDGALFAVERRL